MLYPLQVSFAKVVKSTQYFVYIRVCLVHWFVKSLTVFWACFRLFKLKFLNFEILYYFDYRSFTGSRKVR